MRARERRALLPAVLACAAIVAGQVSFHAQETSASATSASIEAPRQELLPVPLPPLDALEPAVSAQLREAAEAARLLVTTRRGTRELAEAYGALARVHHVYEFFETAEPAYLNAIRLAPRDAVWAHLLGYLYQQTGRFDAAADRFGVATRTDPGDYAATLHLGEVSVQLNRLADARRAFEVVAAVFPAAASNGLGEVALRERRFAEAIAHFERVVDRVPQATSVHYSLAMAYRGLGRLDEARRHLERRGAGAVTAVDPIVDGLQALVRGERALVVRGRRTYEAGDVDAAARDFRAALEAAPDSVAAHMNLGLALTQLGDLPGAVEHLGRAFDVAPEVGLGRTLASALIRLDRPEDAVEVLTGLLAIAPDDEDGLISLALLLADAERYGEAVARLSEANSRFPERITTATTLARLLASAPDTTVRDEARALRLATSVYEADPVPVHAETVALALAGLGRCEEARSWIVRAIAAADSARDRDEATRLRSTLPAYQSPFCP